LRSIEKTLRNQNLVGFILVSQKFITSQGTTNRYFFMGFDIQVLWLEPQQPFLSGDKPRTIRRPGDKSLEQLEGTNKMGTFE